MSKYIFFKRFSIGNNLLKLKIVKKIVYFVVVLYFVLVNFFAQKITFLSKKGTFRKTFDPIIGYWMWIDITS